MKIDSMKLVADYVLLLSLLVDIHFQLYEYLRYHRKKTSSEILSLNVQRAILRCFSSKQDLSLLQ